MDPPNGSLPRDREWGRVHLLVAFKDAEDREARDKVDDREENDGVRRIGGAHPPLALVPSEHCVGGIEEPNLVEERTDYVGDQ